MRVLLINGSPHKSGNTFMALSEVAKSLEQNGLETEFVHIGTRPVRGCIGCRKCFDLGHCTFTDELYTTITDKMRDADAVVVGSPVYYGSANGSLCAILDRLFYSASNLFEYKPAAAVVVARRSGTTATFDRLNKYFTISNMPVVSSQYWNNVHGCDPGEVTQDGEGMQGMRILGNNMAWLLKSIKNGGQPIPEKRPKVRTNFIR